MSESQAAYAEELEDQIREWSGRIGNLKAQADQASAREKIGMLNQIADLTRRKEQLMVLVDELKHAEDESWDRIKNAIQKEADDLDSAYRESIRYFH